LFEVVNSWDNRYFEHIHEDFLRQCEPSFFRVSSEVLAWNEGVAVAVPGAWQSAFGTGTCSAAVTGP
jgi:hypothetical protein